MIRQLYRILFLIFLTSLNVVAAPVGNTGSPIFEDDGLLNSSFPIQLTLSFETDYQKNEFPNQISRFAWTDPSQTYEEERHYEQIRSSVNTFFTNGIRLAGLIGEASQVYLMAGSLIADMEITYYDKTINYGYTTNSKFDSEGEFYYGAGFSLNMYRGTLRKDTLVSVGMDMKYRKLEMSDSGGGEASSLSLDEIQMAFVASAETGRFFPYAGLRLSAISGKEYYKYDNISYLIGQAYYYDNGYIEYRRDIDWFRNVGYVSGLSFYFRDQYLINMELRFGDEEAIGVSAALKF